MIALFIEYNDAGKRFLPQQKKFNQKKTDPIRLTEEDRGEKERQEGAERKIPEGEKRGVAKSGLLQITAKLRHGLGLKDLDIGVGNAHPFGDLL